MRVADSTGDRNATSNECYALSALTVGPSRYTDSLRDLTADHDVADNFRIRNCRPPRMFGQWLRERWLMIPGGDLWRGVCWQLLWPHYSDFLQNHIYIRKYIM